MQDLNMCLKDIIMVHKNVPMDSNLLCEKAHSLHESMLKNNLKLENTVFIVL